MKCSKCDKDADYNSPAYLCEDHWIKWWIYCENDDMTEEQNKEYNQVKDEVKDTKI